MKRKILFTLIGGIIIFAWQFLSFAIPNLHKSASKYTPAQDEILKKFEELNLEEGMYFLGQGDPSMDREAQSAAMEAYIGKPWAVVNYQLSMSGDMVMPMIRGLVVCFMIAFLLFWIYQQQKDPMLINRLLVSLAVGLLGFLFLPYSDFIWYKEPDIYAYLADGIVPWLILGFIGHKKAPKIIPETAPNNE